MAQIETFFIHIPQLNRERKIYVYLPDDYDADGKPYPVIYMHDGQNLFVKKNEINGPTWEVDITMDRIKAETGLSAIVVGVAYSDRRMTDFSPWLTSHPKAFREVGSRGGDGAGYAEFFAKDLKREIEKRYNVVRDRTGAAVLGSSMGGYISYYIGLKYQEEFETMGLFSTAVWFNAAALKRVHQMTPQTCPQHALVYVGGKEGVEDMMTDRTYILGSLHLYDLLAERGIVGEFLLSSGGKHYETVWTVYFEKFARDFLRRCGEKR